MSIPPPLDAKRSALAGFVTRALLRSGLLALCLAIPLSALAEPRDDARRYFAAGLTAAQEGRYQEALDAFLAAQDIYPHPVTLYNIGKAYTDLGDLDAAIRYYELYQASQPDRAADVEPVLAVLRARRARELAPATPAPAPAGTASPSVGATQTELTQLAQIAAQLDALAKSIQERGVAAPDGGTPDGEPVADGTGDGQPDTQGDPATDTEGQLSNDFLADAYERVVITASRVGQDPLDSPSTLTVLTADDLRLSGVLNIPDLLRRVVGVDVMSPASGNADVSIRGFNRELNNKVLILVDGRTIYQDFLSTTIWSSIPVALEEIERIEVIRGPGSAVYGANALTGVINIITRTPGEGDHVILNATAGSPGVGRGAAVLTGREGANAYRFSVSYDQQNRWGSDTPISKDGTLPEGYPLEGFTEDQRRGLFAIRANGRLDHTFNEKAFASLSGGYSQSLSEIQNIGALGNYGFDLTHFYVRGDVQYRPVVLRAFVNSDSGRVAPWLIDPDTNFSLDSRVVNNIADIELEAPLAFETGSIKHQLNIGGGYRYKYFRFGYFAGGFDQPYEEHHFKAFLNEQATIGKLKIVGSLRLDAHPWLSLSETLSPRGSLIYRVFDKTSVRATAGTAFRAPNAVENYMDLALPTPANGAFIRDVGSTNLGPERIATVELGVHDESSLYHQADISIYYNRVTDIIFLDSVTRGAYPYDSSLNGYQVGQTGWINTPDVFQGVGVEAEAEAYPVDGLDVFANANFLKIFETGEDGITVEDRSTSQLKINAGASYRADFRTDFNVTGHYVSEQIWRLREFDSQGTLTINEQEIPARFLLSARVATRPLPTEDLEVGFTIWNIAALANGGFLEHPQGQPVGARVLGHASYRF